MGDHFTGLFLDVDAPFGDFLTDGPLSLKSVRAPGSFLNWGKGAPTRFFFQLGI